MNRFRSLAVLISAGVLLLACTISNLLPQFTTQPAGGETLPKTAIPTFTAAAAAPTADLQTLSARSGFLEVHFLSPFENEAECVIGYPFAVIQDPTQIQLQGENGPFRCFFEHETCAADGCFTINMFWALDTTLNGEVLTTTDGEPSGSVRMDWSIDGLVLIYYSGEHQSSYTRDNPLEVPRQEKIVVTMDYQDGANTIIELPKTAVETDPGADPYRLNFVLHLE